MKNPRLVSAPHLMSDSSFKDGKVLLKMKEEMHYANPDALPKCIFTFVTNMNDSELNRWSYRVREKTFDAFKEKITSVIDSALLLSDMGEEICLENKKNKLIADHRGWVKKKCDAKEQRFFDAFIQQHRKTLTIEDLEEFDINKCEIQTVSEESIHVTARASVWTTYVFGKVNIGEKVFNVPRCWLKSDARSL